MNRKIGDTFFAVLSKVQNITDTFQEQTTEMKL